MEMKYVSCNARMVKAQSMGTSNGSLGFLRVVVLIAWPQPISFQEGFVINHTLKATRCRQPTGISIRYKVKHFTVYVDSFMVMKIHTESLSQYVVITLRTKDIQMNSHMRFSS